MYVYVHIIAHEQLCSNIFRIPHFIGFSIILLKKSIFYFYVEEIHASVVSHVNKALVLAANLCVLLQKYTGLRVSVLLF